MAKGDGNADIVFPFDSFKLWRAKESECEDLSNLNSLNALALWFDITAFARQLLDNLNGEVASKYGDRFRLRNDLERERPYLAILSNVKFEVQRAGRHTCRF